MKEKSEDKPDIEYEVYLSERKSLVKAVRDTAQQFDKAILTLSAGAFAISITFINKIALNPEPWTIKVLVASWLSLIVSMVSTLVSFVTSQKACYRQIEIMEDKTGKSDENKPRVWTDRLNILSITTFIIGIVMLALFSIANLNK